MVSFPFGRTKNNEDLEAYRDITDDVIESDFVPHVCHYNAHTLITKNGELLQIIKISGGAAELLGHREISLRTAIRNAVRECISSDSMAMWLHTIRREADLSSHGESSLPFAKQLNEEWEERNNFQHQYINEVYISIIHEGQDAALKTPQNFIKGLWPRHDIRWRNEYLDVMYDKLNTTVETLVEKLQDFSAHRLTMYEENDIFYSEPSQFLEKLTNLTERVMPVEEEDLSTYLTSGEITFGFNAMEVRVNERRRFASILTIKEYKESSLDSIDVFLKQPMEFIVTQYVNFVHPEAALDQYLDQKLLTDLSGDSSLHSISEVKDIIAAGAKGSTEFGEQQLMVFILADSIKLLERNVRRAVDLLFSFGIVTIREDLRFEQCYWAQLPGNFEFVKRTIPTSISRVGGFANLHNFPVGKAAGNRWGAAVATFHTSSGIPYYFNFHREESGHTSFIGPKGSGKTVLANFLITQATKFDPRIIYFDAEGASRIFMEKLGGRYYHFSPTPMESEDAIRFNPFSLPEGPENKEFLLRWLLVLLRMTAKPINDTQKASLRIAMEATLALPQGERNFDRFMEQLAAQSQEVAGFYADWAKGGMYGHLFTHDEDVFDSHPDMIAFNIRDIMEVPPILIPAASYLLQRSMGEFSDTRPGILVMDEAWELIKNTHVAGNIVGWMNRLTQNNTIALFATESIESVGTQPFTTALMEQMATQIYFPDDDPSEVYQDVLGLTEIEMAYLDVMDVDERHFLIKRGNETVVGELNLTGLDDVLSVLGGKELQDTDNEEDLEMLAHLFTGDKQNT